MKGRGESIERDHEIRHNANAWLAWHVAALSRQKQLPNLRKLLYRKRAAAQTPDQMLSMIRTLNAAFGGADLTQG